VYRVDRVSGVAVRPLDIDGLATTWRHSGGIGSLPVTFQRNGSICQAAKYACVARASVFRY
jgi:hypothetical protein